MKSRMETISFLVVSCVLAFAPIVRSQSPSPEAAAADALFQAQKWAESAKAYEAIIKLQPKNAYAFYRLGTSLYAMGDYEKAAAAFQTAAEIGQNPYPMFSVARAYAKLDQKDKAFEWLNKALNAGLYHLAPLKDDADLASLRDDPRFKDVLALGERLTRPCTVQPEYKQFDFWLGEWDVFMGSEHRGTNSVKSILDGCVVFENWTSDQGPPGKSFNFYDATTHKWQQTWIDSAGNVLNFFGEYKDKALRYTAESLDAKGNKTLHKLTFFDLGPDRVRQLWEQSTDNGKTWMTVWDGMYVRKK